MLFAGSIMAFTSCKKDDDATLEGTWATTKMTQMVYVNDVLKAETSSYPADDERFIVAFKGNQWIQYPSNSEEIPTFSEDQTFVYANGKLTFTGPSEFPPQTEVKSLTGRTLVIRLEYAEDNDESENTKQVTEVTFEKR